MMKTFNFNFYTALKGFIDKSSPLFATRISLLVCIVLTFFGLILGFAYDSLAVQTNSLIAFVDILNSFLFLTAAKQSIREPDYVFNYGYGKYESLSILASGLMITGILGFTFYEIINNFAKPEELVGNRYILLSFSFLSMLLMLFMHKFQKRNYKKHLLPILKYDSKLWENDTIVEFFVVINLLVGIILQYYGFEFLSKNIDSFTALGLATFSLITPLKNARAAFNQLMDRTIDENLQFELLAVIAENLHKMCEFKSIHTRQSGKDIFIELDIIMPFDYTIEQKYELEQTICEQIKKKFPTSIPRLYVVPCNKDCVFPDKRTCPIRINQKKK